MPRTGLGRHNRPQLSLSPALSPAGVWLHDPGTRSPGCTGPSSPTQVFAQGLPRPGSAVQHLWTTPRTTGREGVKGCLACPVPGEGAVPSPAVVGWLNPWTRSLWLWRPAVRVV